MSKSGTDVSGNLGMLMCAVACVREGEGEGEGEWEGEGRGRVDMYDGGARHY